MWAKGASTTGAAGEVVNALKAQETSKARARGKGITMVVVAVVAVGCGLCVGSEGVCGVSRVTRRELARSLALGPSQRGGVQTLQGQGRREGIGTVVSVAAGGWDGVWCQHPHTQNQGCHPSRNEFK